MDGINYSECEEPFKIYSNEIYLTSINPKCGSVKGGTELALLINIDEVTAQNMFHLTVGFQPKKIYVKDPTKAFMDKNKSNTSLENLNESNKSSLKGSRANISYAN